MTISMPPVRFGRYTQEDANDVKSFSPDNNPNYVYVPVYYRKDEPTMLADTYMKSGDKWIHMDTDQTVYLSSIAENHTPTGKGRDFYWQFNEPALDMTALLRSMLNKK
jgi:hypothetical protein